jgi:gliding motility-associated-like protein
LFDLILLQSQISSTPGLTFDFYLNQSDALAGNSATIPNPSTLTSTGGTIYVRIKSTTCAKVVAVNLSVTIKPVAQITASSMVICGNSSVTLTSNSATGNLWSTGATTQSITVSSPGIYTLTVSGNNTYCTSDAASINIFKDADPDVQISGALIFCQGTPTTLNATANGVGNSFLWSNGATTSSIDVNSAGTYTVTVTTVNGCTFTKSTVVTMDPAITININPPAQIDCSQAQITLNATSSVYHSGATFLWTTSGGNIVSGGNTLTPVVNNSGIYTLTITSPTLNGCSKQASVTVIKNNTPPAISVSASQLKICKGSSVTLTATGASTYNWTGLPGTGSSQTVSPTGTTTYTVTGTGANGCTASPVSITITVVPEISSTLQNIEICKGDKGILDAGAGPDYIYNWSTGATTRTITVTTEGNYSVTISNGVCSKTFTAVVNYITTPLIKEIIYSNPNLTIIAQNSGNLSLQYSIDGGVSWQNSNVFTVLKNTQYSIKVRNTGALCETSSEYYTFFMNNVITPNSDGKNDVIDFSEISRFSKFEGSIFDRYGKTVFKADSKNKVWNGTYIGRPLPTGTYWYKMTWEESITKKTIELTGWILLKNRD